MYKYCQRWVAKGTVHKRFFFVLSFYWIPNFSVQGHFKEGLTFMFCVFFFFLLVSLVTNADMRKLYKAFHSFRGSCAKSDVTGMWS